VSKTTGDATGHAASCVVLLRLSLLARVPVFRDSLNKLNDDRSSQTNQEISACRKFEQLGVVSILIKQKTSGQVDHHMNTRFETVVHS
jgi:hypothetical protein